VLGALAGCIQGLITCFVVKYGQFPNTRFWLDDFCTAGAAGSGPAIPVQRSNQLSYRVQLSSCLLILFGQESKNLDIYPNFDYTFYTTSPSWTFLFFDVDITENLQVINLH
jgi:hypothetical protein